MLKRRRLWMFLFASLCPVVNIPITITVDCTIAPVRQSLITWPSGVSIVDAVVTLENECSP